MAPMLLDVCWSSGFDPVAPLALWLMVGDSISKWVSVIECSEANPCRLLLVLSRAPIGRVYDSLVSSVVSAVFYRSRQSVFAMFIMTRSLASWSDKSCKTRWRMPAICFCPGLVGPKHNISLP